MKNEEGLKPLQLEALQLAWQQYTLQLKQNKNSAAQSFERAILKITDPHNFEVITNNNLEQKFIEQEKRNLSDYLQQVFNDKSLSFVITIGENPEIEEPVEKSAQ